MIFIILGTQDKPFVRLLEAVEACHLNEEIVVQAGYTKYDSTTMTCFDYVSAAEFKHYLIEADLIICHGGVGSIMQALELDKRVIAIPRLSQYHEHHNDHQVEIVNSFVVQKHILTAPDLKDLKQVIEESKDFKATPFKRNNKQFIELLNNYIEGAI